VAAVALALLATSCGGGGTAVPDINTAASKVSPPEPLDTKRVGLPGLVVATNSPSLQRLAHAPEGEGAVVLFVEPGGPADGLGIGRGDLITNIGGKQVRNHPRTLTLLHDRPGTKIDVTFKHRDGNTRTVKVEPRKPLVASLRQYLNPLVIASPKDPILRFVRAQVAGPFVSRVQDLDAALKVDRRFVEAITLRASLIWDNRPSDQKNLVRYVNEALNGWKTALQIDPNNTTTLTTRSTVLTSIGSSQQARRDAMKAIEVDNTYPRAYYALALAEAALKQPDKAAAPAAGAISLDPFVAPYWRLLASVFKQLKRTSDCSRTANGFAPFLEAQNFDQDASSLRAVCGK
jgi:hypothetical protein